MGMPLLARVVRTTQKPFHQGPHFTIDVAGWSVTSAPSADGGGGSPFFLCSFGVAGLSKFPSLLEVPSVVPFEAALFLPTLAVTLLLLLLLLLVVAVPVVVRPRV
jgi:hypothetical protein